MPGYLTSMMVLIEADKWLLTLENALNKVPKRSDLENAVLSLAHRVRNDYLRFSYSPTASLSPPRAVASIEPPTKVPGSENLVGNGISQYAFAGSIGPDIASASSILALNQGWVASTMHKGSPRRAWKNARTTSFVLDSLVKLPDNLKKFPPDELIEYKKPYLAMMAGHMASIATHVIVQPFINEWVWTNGDATAAGQMPAPGTPWPMDYRKAKPANRLKLSIQIDAAVAKGYFQRDDLHSGQSWTAYLSDDGKAIDFVCSNYLQAFTSTYGKDPKELLCDLPILKLETAYPQVTKFPDLKNKLEHWSGWPLGTLDMSYKELFDPDSPDPATAQEAGPFNTLLDSLNDLRSQLRDYPAAAPNLTQKFFKDGYRNTRNWALDAGYDHTPFAISLIMSGVILLTATYPPSPVTPQNSDPDSALKTFLGIINISVLFNVWDATTSFGSQDNQKEVTQENLDAWNKDGIDNEIIWFDMFDNSYGACGPVLFLFNAVLTGVSPIFDGIFGKDADALSGVLRWNWRRMYVFFNDILSPIVLFPIIFQRVMPWAYRRPYVRWPLYWLVNVGMDGFEELYVAKGDNPTGLQGDKIGLRIWYLRIWMVAAFLLSSLLVFALKSDKRAVEQDLVARDYLVMLVFPAILIAVLVWGLQGFEGALLQSLVGVDWPDTDTGPVDSLLVIDGSPKDGKSNTFKDGAGTPQKVALFAEKNLTSAKDISPDGTLIDNYYYPEAPDKTAWNDRPDADEKARKDGRIQDSSAGTYRLKELFDSASVFAGILGMALANFDAADDVKVKKADAHKIFADWNLDFRTDVEWKGLMGADKGALGIIPAAQQWVSELTANPAAPSKLDLTQLTAIFGLPAAAAIRPTS